MAKQNSTNTKKEKEKKIENKKEIEEKVRKETDKKRQKPKEAPKGKQIKKETKQTAAVSPKDKVKKKEADEVTKLVEVILILLVVFAAFYIITYWVKKAKTNTNINQKEPESAIIQYDEIVMGRIFLQNHNEYYVLIIEEDDDNNYASYLASYKEKENALRFYTVKLESAFNKPYKAETAKLDTNNIKEVKVKETTLIRIKEKKIEESIEGKTAVLKKLGELIK